LTDPEERAARGAAMGRISSGSGNKERRSRAERIAGAFRENPELERLIELREKSPDRYDALSPTLKLATGYYLEAKKAHEESTGGDAA
jgi:hypothetical protein